LAQGLSILIILAGFFISNEEREPVKKLTRRLTAVTAISAAAVTFVGVGIAHASETFPPPGTYTAFPDPAHNLPYNIVGSETLQDVMGGMTQGYTWNNHTYTPDSFGADVGNWNAINPGTGDTYDSIQPVTSPTAGDTFDRPNGSGDGICMLSAANNPASNTCVENGVTQTISNNPGDEALAQQELSIARASALPSESDWSSDNPTGGVSGNADDLTFFPVGIDAVGVSEALVGDSSSTEVTNFNTGALTAIYGDGTYTQTAGTSTVGDIIEQTVNGSTQTYPFVVTAVTRSGTVSSDEQVIPSVPQASSGTRKFFLAAIGESSFNTAVVADETGTVAEEENHPAEDLSVADLNAALDQNSPSYQVPTSAAAIAIAPMSGAQLIEQQHGFVTNSTSGFDFPTINGESLDNGSTGDAAAIATSDALQSGTPEITFGDSVVGNFTRYVWLGLPTSEVSTTTSDEGALQTWVDDTVPSETVPWTDFGFQTVSVSGVSNNPDFWVHTTYTNG
jgi:hypothetical protein